jgi:hypothetical protein
MLFARRRLSWLPLALLTLALLMILYAMVWPLPAHSQTTDIPVTVVVRWTNPTVGCTPNVTPCDNAPLTGPQALTETRIYGSRTAIPDNTTAQPVGTVAAPGTQYTWNTTAPVGSSLFIRAKSCNTAACSVLSGQATKPVVLAVPNAPEGITITITIAIQTPPSS